MSRPSVLYVEDDKTNIRLIERILRLRPGVDLVVATGGQAGIDLAVDCAPSLILLDRRLPDILGDEVLRRLKASTSTSGIPVIMFSGDSGREHVDEFLRLGAAGFLAKPISVADFLGVVDRYCVA